MASNKRVSFQPSYCQQCFKRHYDFLRFNSFTFLLSQTNYIFHIFNSINNYMAYYIYDNIYDITYMNDILSGMKNIWNILFFLDFDKIEDLLNMMTTEPESCK